MSRIDAMIAELCPDGVPFRPIGAVADIATARVVAGNLDGGTYVGVDNLLPNFGGRRDSDYLAGVANAIGYGPGDVLIGNIRPYLKKVWLADRSGGASPDVVTLRPRAQTNEEVVPAFLYYLIASDAFINYSTQHARGGKMPRGDKAAMLRYRIPVPAVKVQREIVRTLDAFQDLGMSLEAELELRARQLTHYRERVLRFPADVSRSPMGKVGDFVRGRRFTKADYIGDGGVACIHYGEIYTHYGVSATTTISRLRGEMSPSLRFAEKNDVVIATVGETVEDVAKSVAWLGDERAAFHDDSCRFRSEMNPKFVAYVMQTRDFQAQKNMFVARGKLNRISGADLARVLVPVPRPEEQERVVAVLDAFNTLINDTSSGLPAEIKARRRQFEHYRERLLSFDEATA